MLDLRAARHTATTVDARPEWLPEEYEHFTVTREEVWNELDRDARRLFGLTADEFLRIFRNPRAVPRRRAMFAVPRRRSDCRARGRIAAVDCSRLPAPHSRGLRKYVAMIRRQTTGQGLTANAAFVGLADHGLFNDRMPHCFTSEGLSGYVTQNMLNTLAEKDDRKLRKALEKTRHDFIRYDALRDVNVPRQLGAPHPESHLLQCLVMEHYWGQIKRHCRKPAIPASRTYVRKMSANRVFHMTYKGKERDGEERDLRRMAGAQYVVTADISACYPSIYTHSIPWAMHGKTKAKKIRGSSLPGNLLDSVTQGTRDGQTNGLLIGPDTSSVISEIILTEIDAIVQSQGFKRFSRYIDDYTYYARTHEEAEQFVHQLSLSLRDYELVLNERKTSIALCRAQLNPIGFESCRVSPSPIQRSWSIVER